MFISDERGRIVRVNSRWTEYTGLTAADTTAERAEPLGLVHRDDLEATWAAWQQSLATGQPYEISYRLRSAKDGRYRWFLARAVPVRDAGGTVVQWVGAATEIDDHVRAGELARFLSAAAAALSGSLDETRIVDDFMEVAVSRFCSGCTVIVCEPDGSFKRAGIRHRDPQITAAALARAGLQPVRSGGAATRVMETKQPLLIPDVGGRRQLTLDGVAPMDVNVLFDGTQALLIVPLLVAGEVSGTLSFASTDAARTFDDKDLEAALAVARHAAVALENARAFVRERDRSDRLHFLSEATNRLFEQPTPAAGVNEVLHATVGAWADWAVLFLRDRNGAVRAETVAYRDPAYAALEAVRGQRLMIPDGERLFEATVAKRRPVMRVDIEAGRGLAYLQPYLHETAAQVRPKSSLLVPLFAGDEEFGALGLYLADRNYGDADRELFEELGVRVSLSFEHARSVEREVRLVQTLQEVILPAQLPAVPGVELSTVYAPATTSDAPVGGDWYDVFALDGGRYVLSIGDVAGRGLRASAIMGKLRHAINVVALYESDPARILDVAERVVLQRYPNALATAFVALIDPQARRLQYANAGHPYPLLRLYDGTVQALFAEGLPIGLRTMAEGSPSRTRQLDDVALIAFYTDGVTEATRDIERGERVLHQALSAQATLFVRDPAALVAASCLTEGPHGDDAALLLVKFPHSVAWTFFAENASAAQHARGDFMQRLRAQAAATSDFTGAENIFGELIGNVVRHAPGAIDIALEWRAGSAVLHVTDRGRGFEYRPNGTIDMMQEGGRGLWLVAHFGLRFEIDTVPGFGAHVAVTLPVSQRSG